MLKKLAVLSCGFFAMLSSMNLAGIMCISNLHEPKPPHMRGE
jgi:hypothetical protein